jgi:predicted metal-dependent peptidase
MAMTPHPSTVQAPRTYALPSRSAARMGDARALLVTEQAWFGMLSLRLVLQEDSSTKTMSVDGTTLRFNPVWVSQQPNDELRAGVAHEVMHCAMLHPYRFNGRQAGRWNRACDLAINPILKDAGFKLPDGALDDPRFHGLAAEQIYAALPDEDPNGGEDGCTFGGSMEPGQDPTPSQGTPDPNAPPSPGQSPAAGGRQSMGPTDWQIAAEQATMVANKQGDMSADVDRAVKATRVARTDWREALRRFVEHVTPQDYTWARPNRRFIAQGIYLPGVHRENLPPIDVCVDTSGSVSPPMLARFAAELDSLMREARPESVRVVYCDSSVKGEEEFSPDGGEVILRALGGGGTRFQPALDHCAARQDPPAAIVYLTDLLGPEPTDPGIPVLWCTPEQSTRVGWFGETVRLAEFD